MKIGIVGYGVVGHALKQVFEEKAHVVLVNEVIPMASTNYTKAELVQRCSIIFLCVQTPTKEDGTQDLQFLRLALAQLAKICADHYPPWKPLFVIKSTVLPETTNQLKVTYPNLRIAVNPEFLRQKAAVEDARNPDRIVIGSSSREDTRLLFALYRDWTCKKYWFENPTDAELVKYLSNLYLVSKVAFACEIQNACNVFGGKSWMVARAITSDHRINPSHLTPDFGKIPRESPCLPKDAQAFQHMLIERSKGSMRPTPLTFTDAIYKFGVEPEK